MIPNKTIPIQFVIFSLAMANAPLMAGDTCTIKTPLQSTGLDSDASGVAQAQIRPSGSMLTVSLSKLTAGASYTLQNGGIPEATFVADSKGRARVNFASKVKKGVFPFDFDPRQQTLSVLDSTSAPVLQAVISGTGEPVNTLVNERVEMSIPNSRAKASAQFIGQTTGRRMFSVQLSGITGSNWALYVDGVLRGAITTRGASGTISFDTQTKGGKSLPLDFEPRGKTLDITSDGQIVFSATMAARAAGINVATPTIRTATIPSTGADADATAKATLKVDKKARQKFSVELENLPAGVYELLANGTSAANITVGESGEGEVEFSSSNDEEDALPLSFDPATTVFTVQSGGTVYFQGALTFTTVGSEPSEEVELPLFNTGVHPAAKAEMSYEREEGGELSFEVEVKDVPVGTCELWVGATQRATITVVATNSGTKGKVEFENDSDDLPLDFNPLGETIRIQSAGVVWFERVLPADL